MTDHALTVPSPRLDYDRLNRATLRHLLLWNGDRADREELLCEPSNEEVRRRLEAIRDRDPIAWVTTCGMANLIEPGCVMPNHLVEYREAVGTWPDGSVG